MPRTDSYDIRREDFSYDVHRAQNTSTGWLVALILIVAAVAVVMFLGRSDVVMNNRTSIPGANSSANPPISQPATTPATVPNPTPPYQR
jgi:hypothetical protein